MTNSSAEKKRRATPISILATMKRPILNTINLRLRPLQEDDAEGMFNIFRDAQTMRYMPTGAHRTVAETQLMLMSALADTARYWAIELNNASHELIGYIGFLADTPIPGMGYLIARKHWRKGYAREACLAVMDYGFFGEKLEQIELWIHEDNVASLGLAEKLGFRRKGRIRQRYHHQKKQHNMAVYGLWGWEWRQRKAPQERIKTYGMQVVLGVRDVMESAEFYRDKLGFRIDFVYGNPPNHAAVSRSDWTGDNVTIRLDAVPSNRELNFSGNIYIFTDSGLKRLHRLYRDSGVEIVSRPQTQPWGMLEFAIRDCNGYVIMFGTHAT